MYRFPISVLKRNFDFMILCAMDNFANHSDHVPTLFSCSCKRYFLSRWRLWRGSRINHENEIALDLRNGREWDWNIWQKIEKFGHSRGYPYSKISENIFHSFSTVQRKMRFHVPLEIYSNLTSAFLLINGMAPKYHERVMRRNSNKQPRRRMSKIVSFCILLSKCCIGPDYQNVSLIRLSSSSS